MSPKPHLERIGHPAFHGDGLDSGLAEWALAKRVTDRIESAVVEAALLLIHLAQYDSTDEK